MLTSEQELDPLSKQSGEALTAWEKEHVLNEAGEHVPRLKVHERADEIETVCCY